ncbi:MAG: FAD-dependent oxidoreductase [Deltaproteobacteria bacterium]|jgi:nitrite reductase (NADH) large subunit|nr:FAD-dependent oxidoreductase [Deltaproteobacteria bacterium]
MMNIVIAGCGVAGVTAAETARQKEPSANITVFSLERDALYYRPRLPEIISGKLEIEKIYAHPDSWYQEKNIELRKGESLLEVCTESRLVRGALGSRLNYDRILIATGAESAKPAPVDYQLPGVFTVRRLPDAMALFYEAKRSQSAVIVGGGLLALEIGCALGAVGVKVHILERSERILPRQTTPASSAKLNSYLTEKGLEFHLGASLASVKGRDRLTGVELTNGLNLSAQILIVAAGITPNLKLAQDLGLKTDRGIVVDHFLETTLEDIYAAGDCAQTPDGFGGLWTIGRQQGLVAGHNLVCGPTERIAYQPTPPSSTLKVAGLDLVAAGNIDPDGKLNSVVAETEKTYRKVVVDVDSLLVGYTNLGTTKGNRELAGALGTKKLSEQTLTALADPNFDFVSF